MTRMLAARAIIQQGSAEKEIPTARSASNCATRVCACWRIRSEDVLPKKDVAFALYPNVNIRDLSTALGRRLLPLSQQVPDLVVQVL